MKHHIQWAAAVWLFGAAAAFGQETEVYLTPMSHLDFYWGGTREECLARGNQIIAKVVHLAQQSPQFRFLLEDENFVANYVESHRGSEDLATFEKFVKEGRIEVAPKWAAIFQGLPDGEVQARNLVIGKRYAQTVLGVDPHVAHLGDLPDYTPQFPQLLSQARVPYMVMTRMGPSDKSLFYWKAPDGSKALVWNTLKGYGWGTFLTSSTTTLDQKRARFQKEVEDIRSTVNGPILMNWGTDLWAPPEDFIERINSFSRVAPAKLAIATPSDFFHRVEKSEGIAELAGEIPSSWPNIVSSLPHLWPQIIPATNTLLAAEKFAAINHALGYADYPQKDLDFLWKKLIESMDHNHDGQGGAIADGRKAEYEQLSIIRGGEILRDSLRNIAERVEVPVRNSFPIVVFNPMSWNRDDIVRSHVALFGEVAPADIGAFKKGMRLVDDAGRPVPFHVEEYSENISRSLQLVFVAQNVPSLGYRTYYLTSAVQPEAFPAAASIQLDSDKDAREPRRSLGTDTIENRYYRVTVDRAAGRVTLLDKDLNREVARDMEVVATEERGGNYIGIEPTTGRGIFSTVDDIRVEENNAVRAVVRIALRIADIRLVQRLTLFHDLKRLDVENVVEWRSPRLFRIEQLFPVSQETPSFDYGVPFGANRADNILPNAGTHQSDEISMEDWRRSRHIHDWIRAGDGEWGLTIATDHQQVRLDGRIVRAQMVRGTRFTSVKVVRGGEASGQRYPPLGTYTFRYSLSSAAGDWRAAKSYRSGMGLTNPLIPVSVVDSVSRKTLPAVHSFCSVEQGNVVISALKKADADSAVVLRVYDVEGAPVNTAIKFLDKTASFSEVNLLEEESSAQAQTTLRAGPNAIRTLKLRKP
jgi:hypothetical protein